MEYVQMTLNDWLEVKHRLKMELQGVKQSFVRIGFVLRKIDDQKLYEQDGYKSVAEFAKAEYGLEASTVSRFMSINREYSVDGYSEHLREEYLDMSRSQLEEMLKLPDTDRVMIRPEAARDDIRELKKFNKAEPVAGIADDIVQLIEKFYEENPKILNELFTESPTGAGGVKYAIEIVNPAGNRSYKKGLFFLMMYENKIVIKKFGTTPEEMTWERFLEITYAIFADSANGPKTWEKHFCKESELVAVQEEKEPEKPVVKKPEKEIARAQKSEENQGFEGNSKEKNEAIKEPAEEQIPGQMEATDYPEMMPEEPAEKNHDECEKSEDTGRIPETVPGMAETERSEQSADEAPVERTETPQSDREGNPAESEKYEKLKEDAEELAHGVYDVFWGWSDEKSVPKGELKVALKNAKKLVQMIEQLIEMTGEENA